MSKSEDYQLKVEDIHLSFGGLKALSGVSTGVKKGEIFSIIGTTFTRAESILLSGISTPTILLWNKVS